VERLSASERDLREIRERFSELGLKQYQAAVLASAILLGETTASALVRAAKVPSARVYEILAELSAMGLLKVRPGRPVIYSSASPAQTVRILVSLRRAALEAEMKDIADSATSLIQKLDRVKARVPVQTKKSPLVRLVDAGEASEQETTALYKMAKDRILIFSRALEYLPRVVEELAEAGGHGVSLRIILLDPSRLQTESIEVQDEMVALLKSRVPDAQVRFSPDVPLRGSIVDPETQGAAVFLAEEKGVPLFVREVALTRNMGLVRSLARFFDLMWQTLPMAES
jgi:sugar-specific transcriptional regulator TrmB